MFSSRSFIVLGHMFKSLIYFELIFMYGMRSSSLFTIASKRIIDLERNLTKEFKDLYTEKCKTLMKEIDKGTNKTTFFGSQKTWIFEVHYYTQYTLVEFASWPHQLLVVRPWARYFINLRCVVYKSMTMILLPTSRSCSKDYLNLFM